MMARGRDFPRDQELTPFSAILTQLCECTGARCAALVDGEGETVDYGGYGDPFDIRVLAAEWRLVLQHLERSPLLAQTDGFVVRAHRKSFLVESLPEGYALVVQLGRRATSASSRALALARKEVCEEAGFNDLRPSQEDWSHVAVEEEPGSSHRPMRMKIEQDSHELTVLGRIAPSATAEREQSYRVRLSTGEERTLVREPLGFWYLEEDSW